MYPQPYTRHPDACVPGSLVLPTLGAAATSFHHSPLTSRSVTSKDGGSTGRVERPCRVVGRGVVRVRGAGPVVVRTRRLIRAEPTSGLKVSPRMWVFKVEVLKKSLRIFWKAISGFPRMWVFWLRVYQECGSSNTSGGADADVRRAGKLLQLLLSPPLLLHVFNRHCVCVCA